MEGNFFIQIFNWLLDVSERHLMPFHILRQYEAGVVLKFGKFHYELKHGWNWKIPFIHESLTCLIKPETLEIKPFTVFVGSEQISVGLVGCYHVFDGKKFLLEANDAQSNIPHHFIQVASDHITETKLEDLISKTTPYTEIKRKLNKELEYIGVKFTMVGYTSICKVRPFSLINN
jgi:regulator of protease activity HflC (stomatin/prohibitin superfamily)